MAPHHAYAVHPAIVCVVAIMAKRVQVDPYKRTEEGIAAFAQMRANYARMEVKGQPWGGWLVDIDNQGCPCNYCIAFGVCVHVVYALRTREHVDNRGRNVLVNRSKRRRGANEGENCGGRPRLAGQALTF
ncbi:hypothetical protein GQ600_15304 [Phytophthora cactorum]|nr:hypothetical protein GQ600_15304 [Phytophthora cactorum]